MAKEDIKKVLHKEMNEKSLSEDEIAMINRIRKLDLKPYRKKNPKNFNVLDYIGFIKEDSVED